MRLAASSRKMARAFAAALRFFMHRFAMLLPAGEIRRVILTTDKSQDRINVGSKAQGIPLLEPRPKQLAAGTTFRQHGQHHLRVEKLHDTLAGARMPPAPPLESINGCLELVDVDMLALSPPRVSIHDPPIPKPGIDRAARPGFHAIWHVNVDTHIGPTAIRHPKVQHNELLLFFRQP